MPHLIEIPSHYNNKSVIAIGCYAFLKITEIEEVRIHADIQAIHIGAFYGCYNLHKINIPSTCELLAKSALDCRFQVGTSDDHTDDIYNEGKLEVWFEPNSQLKEIQQAAIHNAAHMIIYIFDKISPKYDYFFASEIPYTTKIFSPYLYKFCGHQTTLFEKITCQVKRSIPTSFPLFVYIII